MKLAKVAEFDLNDFMARFIMMLCVLFFGDCCAQGPSSISSFPAACTCLTKSFLMPSLQHYQNLKRRPSCRGVLFSLLFSCMPFFSCFVGFIGCCGLIIGRACGVLKWVLSCLLRAFDIFVLHFFYIASVLLSQSHDQCGFN